MVILFQGDSITDSGRSREADMHIGHGYAQLAKAHLCFREPGKYKILNRGINGNRSTDIYARIKSDMINLGPDFISILMGVNDVWHEIGSNNGVATPKYETIYTMLIEELREALPDVKLMMLEPFVLEGPATTGTLADGSDKYERFRRDVEDKARAARRVADKFGVPFVELQRLFDEATKKQPSTYWLYDGVHPSPAGHQLIANEWLAMFDKIMGE